MIRPTPSPGSSTACWPRRITASAGAGYWLDVARYGEDQAHSFQPRLYPNGFRYRDWLIGAFNRDMPYDRFIIEQIAGDLLDGPDRAPRPPAGAGLLRLRAGLLRRRQEARPVRRPHRHPDPRLPGPDGRLRPLPRPQVRPDPDHRLLRARGRLRQHRLRRSPRRPPGQVEAYDKAQAAIKAKEKAITDVPQGRGEAAQQKVTKDQLKAFERMLPGDAKKTVKAMRAELDELKKKAPPKYPVIHALADASQPTDMPVLVRGNPATPGAKVPRRFLTVLGGDRVAVPPGEWPARAGPGHRQPRQSADGAGDGQPGLAAPLRPGTGRHGEQLRHAGRAPEPPRAARLAGPPVRRIGLVAQGAAPRDPALVDLPAEQPASTRRASTKDPGNTLLWRMNRRRLDVEAWRDAMLAVAGRLDESLGGPSVGLDAPGNRRRTAYAAVSRHDLAWMLRLFDFPDPNITSGGRVETTVPLQQLFVLNSELMVDGRPGRRRPAAPAGRGRPGRRRPHPPGLPAALRPRGDRPRARDRPGLPPSRRSARFRRPGRPPDRPEPLGSAMPRPSLAAQSSSSVSIDWNLE